MMDLLDMSVKLVVKAPNQKIADQTVDCALNWTVRRLKQHLSDVYPSRPLENQQRIIYSGKLLQDDLTLKDVLKQYDPSQTTHTVHLVCAASVADSVQQQQQSTTAAESSTVQAGGPVPTEVEGLRHRHGATVASSGVSAGVAGVSHAHQYPYSYYQYAGYGNYPYPYGNTYPTTSQPITGYSPEQLAMMQQYAMWQQAAMMQQAALTQQSYEQYVAQYMQYLQVNNNAPANQQPPVANQNAANNNIGRAGPQQQQMRMNAQGGAIDDDDEDPDNRDWLDWLYTLIRFFILLSIMYFYSTVGRLAATVGLVVLVYLYQAGWFRLNRQEVPVQQQQQQQRQQQQQQAAPADPEAEQEERDERDDNEDNEEQTETEAQPPPRPNVLAIAWTFISTFITSLAPEQPQPVNAN